MRCKCSQMVDPNNHWEPNALAGPDRTDSLDWPADMLSVRPCHEAVRTSTIPAGCKRMAKMPIEQGSRCDSDDGWRLCRYVRTPCGPSDQA